MKRIIFGLLHLFVIIAIFAGCEKDNIDLGECSTHAVIRDLSGLDGCGFVFELDNGDYLEPQGVVEDLPFGFEFEDGKQVMIEYEIQFQTASICMAGAIVKITCIRTID